MTKVKRKAWLKPEQAANVQLEVDKGGVVFGLATDGMNFWEVAPTMEILDNRIVLTHTYLARIGVKSPVAGPNAVFVSGDMS